MKRKIFFAGVVVLIVMLISYYAYEIYPFAKGVRQDAKKGNEFLKIGLSELRSLGFFYAQYA